MWPYPYERYFLNSMLKSFSLYTGIEIRAGIADGTLDPHQMIEQCLARCESIQSQLNPFTAIYHDDAMAAAKLVKDRQANGLPMRPMEGIPIAIKEFTPIKGKRTTRGSIAL